MRGKLIILIILGICLGCMSCKEIGPLKVPPLQGRVNDLSKRLSKEEISKLETKLKEHEDLTSNQIVILLIPSLQGEVLEEFSMKVCEKWKLGKKGKDNGLLILCAMADKKCRIEVGYGLEPILTDAVCGRIIRKDISSNFKEEDYYEGLDKATSSIISYLTNPTEAEAQIKKKMIKKLL